MKKRNLIIKAIVALLPIIILMTGCVQQKSPCKKQVKKYAELFYRKRFIEEKEVRINEILNPEETDTVILDVPFKVE